MLILGDFNRLTVARIVDFGIYLESEDGDVLMPGKYVPEGTKPGDEINAFVYRDSEDRIIATTLTPKVKVNEFAVLEVVDENNHGSFLDMGLEKDLFVPYSHQKDRMAPGDWHPVFVYADEITDRLVATAKIGKYIKNHNIQVQEGDPVTLLVISETDLGYKVIIDNKYLGMLYANEI
ncbi:MAG: GntR family transcriptional regulator, partial [Chitinophagaceae bacterium]